MSPYVLHSTNNMVVDNPLCETILVTVVDVRYWQATTIIVDLYISEINRHSCFDICRY